MPMCGSYVRFPLVHVYLDAQLGRNGVRSHLGLRHTGTKGEVHMKNLVWVIVAAIIAVGGYVLYSGRSVQEIASDVTATATTATNDAVEAASEAASDAADVAADAVEATTDAASDAATAVSEAATAVADAVTATTEAASDAATAVTETATAATEAASDAATAATDTVTATTDAATDTAAAATDTAAAATDTAAAATDAASGSMMELLTVDGFNLEKVTTMLEGSDLGAVQKTMLTNGLKAAQDNPDLLKSALDAVRQALGM